MEQPMTYKKPSEHLKGTKLAVGQVVSPAGLGWDAHPNFGQIPDFEVTEVNADGNMKLGKFACKCGTEVVVHPGDLFQKRFCAVCKKGTKKPKTAKASNVVKVKSTKKAAATVTDPTALQQKTEAAKAAIEAMKAAKLAAIKAKAAPVVEEAKAEAAAVVTEVLQQVEAAPAQVESSVVVQAEETSTEDVAAVAMLDARLQSSETSKIL